MTVVNPKSISGINSITMASGGDDLLTIHSNNTTERVRVNNSGDVIVGSGVTLSPDGDVFATGVCTATSFVGSGANLTGVSAVSVANQADNRVITNTGTTDALNAEANLTFSGSELVADSSMITAQNTGTGSGASKIQLQPYGTDGYINCTASGNLYTRMGTGFTTRTQIDSSGNFTVSSGNLVIGTSGKGIDFSATANSGTSELLDDYEEGSWTPAFAGSGGAISVTGYSLQSGKYTKIGNYVYIEGQLRAQVTNNSTGTYDISGLPYTVDVNGSGGVFVCYDQHAWVRAPHQFIPVVDSTVARAREGIDVGDTGYTNGQSDAFNAANTNCNRVYFAGSYRIAQTIRYVYKLTRLNLF